MELKTMREFLNAVIAIEGVDAEVADFASAEIAKIDATNAKRKAKAAEKREADTEFVDMFVSFLSDTALTASDIKAKFIEAGVAVIADKDLTVQKVSALGKRAVAEGKATKVDVKVAKKGTQVGYVLA